MKYENTTKMGVYILYMVMQVQRSIAGYIWLHGYWQKDSIHSHICRVLNAENGKNFKYFKKTNRCQSSRNSAATNIAIASIFLMTMIQLKL
ncbi:hypothetical protein T4B_15204 [Trichinella pseudospiralis]|uniref:Uncharacterized protein n=2 Tax=Trichinella pseudospiralis TaxID=6337 RepID=A0A0V1FRD3_TRIPS|nr:hypothetical protein T4A_4007 [Trichinella pseudospiralis]KRY88573.1 hypothetical protein T4D_14742 [Trichinella pseudospiralis]KRZ32626.1 hypothetical protein T4B_15204 [Trichinella pseudospiralis]KRZ40801.1 hypothetical protein T4C_6306 [Trichinella pseudospiralis]